MHTLFDADIAEIAISYSTHVAAKDRPKITTSGQAYNIFKTVFPQLEHVEYFYIILMNRSNAVLGVKMISMGGIAGTVADPKVIFQTALKANASSLILGHNHPSGQLTPSEADNTLTLKLKNAGTFLDLPILDHIILTNDSYYSYRDEGNCSL